MGECVRIEKCTFFHGLMASMPANQELYRKNYCYGKSDDCARNFLIRRLEENNYQVSEQLERDIERLSPHLAPNQHEKVIELFSA